jgi:hypothetical protein
LDCSYEAPGLQIDVLKSHAGHTFAMGRERQHLHRGAREQAQRVSAHGQQAFTHTYLSARNDSPHVPKHNPGRQARVVVEH